MVEAAGVELRDSCPRQQLGRNRIGQPRQNRSKRRVEVHNRYSSAVAASPTMTLFPFSFQERKTEVPYP